MRKSAKWIGRIMLFLLLLAILFILLLHTPFAKNLIRGKLEAYLTTKTGGQFHIAAINYRLPQWIQMDGVSVENQSGDTILVGQKMRIDINLLKVLRGKYEVNKIALEDVYFNAVKKPGDTTFNYQFLIDAFTTKNSDQGSESTPLSLSLNEIHILRSGFKYADPQTGMLLNTKLGKVDLQIDSVDVYKMHFGIRNADMSDVLFDMLAYPPVNATVGGLKPALPVVNVGQSHIERTHFIYKDENTGISTDDVIKDLHVTDARLRASGSVQVAKADLVNSDIAVNRRSFENAKLRIDTTTGSILTDSLGVFHIDDIKVTDTRFVYNDIDQPARGGFDMDHIAISKLKADANDIDYTGKKMNASIAFVSGKDKSGFTLDTLRGNFAVTDSLITAENILAKTPYSRISGSALLYPFNFLPNNRAYVQNRIRMTNNIISKRDLELLVPDLLRPYRQALAGINTIFLTAEADGNASRMLVHRAVMYSNRKDVYLDASGTLMNVTSKNNFRFDANINRLDITRAVVEGALDAKTRQMVSLPPSLHARGTVRGSMQQLTNNLTVTSEYGAATITGDLRNFMNPTRLGYNVTIIAKELETGKWVRQDSLLGKINGRVRLKGSGFDYKRLDLDAGADLASFRILQHNYTDIHLTAVGRQSNFDVKGNTGDPLLQTNFDANLDLSKRYPSGKGVLNVQNFDPYALGFYADSLSIVTRARFDVKNLDPAALNAWVKLDSSVLRQGGRVYRVDSLVARGYQDSGQTFLTVNSIPLDASLQGNYNYLELGNVFQQVASRYTGVTTTVAPTAHYDIRMQASLKPDPLYAVLIPGLFFDKNIVMRGRIDDNRTDSSRYVDISAPGISYSGTKLTNLSAHAVDISDSLRFTAKADTIKAGSILLYTTNIRGGLFNGNLTANIASFDQDNKERYALAVSGNNAPGVYQVHLSDRLKLNYDDWNVNNGNTISVGTGGFNVSQLDISKGAQHVALNSSSTELNAPIDLKVDNFQLRTITGLFDENSMQLDGVLNASAKVSDFDKPVPLLDGSLTVDSLRYQDIALGKLDLKANAAGYNTANLTGSLTGNGNNVELNGKYNAETVDATLNLNPVQFKTIEPFTAGMLAHSSGAINGSISITGPVTQPQWNGSLRFDSASTRITQFGTALSISNQTIELKYPMVSFNQFTIRDSLNHALVIDGNLTQTKEQSANANLTIKTKDFMVMNSSAVNNNMLYGTAIVDADVTVNGSVMAPDINGNLGLKDGSNITFVRQTQAATAKDRESVMQFVDMDTVRNDFITPVLTRNNDRLFPMLRYNLNIDISKEAQFSVILDPLTRDALQVKGAGSLNAGIRPDGAISLTGSYNLSQGSYEMNYQFIRRKFTLQEGSTLTFTGDPMNAQADITAIYDVSTSPYDLIGNEVADPTGTNAKVYDQRVPFQVLLHITGRVSAPELKFDVRMKEDIAGMNYNYASTIENKLSQLRGDEAGMNKQVFGLLVMGRFIGEQSTDFFNNLGGSSGFSPNDLVVQSVSRFLNEAVNQAAANLIKGVDINFDLANEQNYTNNTERTDLNVALSKRFMNDRLTVTIGKSFTVEGDDPSAKGTQGANSQFIPDITTAYKLSKDGRYMLKVYQRNQYEAILDGYYIETGVAFSLVMDYNKLRELIKKNKQ
jgi:translocation and assembly module TamB